MGGECDTTAPLRSFFFSVERELFNFILCILTNTGLYIEILLTILFVTSDSKVLPSIHYPENMIIKFQELVFFHCNLLLCGNIVP